MPRQQGWIPRSPAAAFGGHRQFNSGLKLFPCDERNGLHQGAHCTGRLPEALCRTQGRNLPTHPVPWSLVASEVWYQSTFAAVNSRNMSSTSTTGSTPASSAAGDSTSGAGAALGLPPAGPSATGSGALALVGAASGFAWDALQEGNLGTAAAAVASVCDLLLRVAERFPLAGPCGELIRSIFFLAKVSMSTRSRRRPGHCVRRIRVRRSVPVLPMSVLLCSCQLPGTPRM